MGRVGNINFSSIMDTKNIHYMIVMYVTQKHKNSNGCISYCQNSVKLWKYVNKLFYHYLTYMKAYCAYDCDYF